MLETQEPKQTTAFRATVVLATWNRKDELRRAIESSLAQTVPVEIIVMDDGSTDGTVEMVREHFPQVRIYQDGVKLGPNRNRHRGIELASTEYVFPIDDDAMFVSPHTVRQTLADFDHPRVGAVAIPFHEVSDGRQLQLPPTKDGVYITPRYIGCCVAMRRSVFLGCGGYTASQFNYGEESDLCLRMLERGYVTRLGRSDLMEHTRSPVRNVKSSAYRVRRNAVMRAWQNAPLIYLLPTLAALLFMFLSKSKSGQFSRWETLKAIGDGVWQCARQRGLRQPVSRRSYRSWLTFRRKDPITFNARPLRLDAFESSMPPRQDLPVPPAVSAAAPLPSK